MIYLVRHGLDDERYIGGWSNVDLINIGKVQIYDATKFIVEKRLVINKIISSDIKRAKSTSEIINEKLNLDIIYTSELRELDKGIYTGLLKKNIKKDELEIINNFNIYDRYPKGEAMIDLYKRMRCFLEKIRLYDNVLLVTHRGVINMFYYILLDEKLDMNKEKFNVSHASIHEMDIEKKLIRRIY